MVTTFWGGVRAQKADSLQRPVSGVVQGGAGPEGAKGALGRELQQIQGPDGQEGGGVFL